MATHPFALKLQLLATNLGVVLGLYDVLRLSVKATFDAWYEGYGKYGIRAIWMDESEPDHSVSVSDLRFAQQPLP